MALITNSDTVNTEFTPSATGVFRFYNTGGADITLYSARATGQIFARVEPVIPSGVVVEVNNPTTSTVYKWRATGSAAAAYADQ